MKKLVTKTFRDSIQKLIPNCKTLAHWEMLRMAMFSTFTCKETGAVRFGANDIAEAHNTIYTNHFKAGKKLREFLAVLPEGSASILMVNGKEWMKGEYKTLEPSVIFDEETQSDKVVRGFIRVGDGMQRRVLFTWPQAIKDLLEKELRNKDHYSTKVYFVNGNKHSAAKERKVIKEVIEECLSAVDILESPAASYMAHYLNELPTNSFTKLTDNAELAFNAISNIESEVVRDQQLKILNAVLESPKPVYRPSKNGNTDRLFGHGANITNLKKEVRQALTKDWVEFDLQSSQLAIVAKLWNIKPLHKFLSGSESIWNEMYRYFDIEMASNDIKKAVKKALKERIYGIVYGESKERIVNGREDENDEGLTSELDALGIKDGGLRFVNHPLMKEVLKARKQYMKTILDAGQAVDAYDIVHEVSRTNVLSIMSRIAQSYEQVLIYGVFELACNEANNDFSIQLLQHDGVSIKFHDDSKKQYWINKICDYVNSAAKSWDIPTKLVYEDNTKVEIVSFEQDVVAIPEYNIALTKSDEFIQDSFSKLNAKAQLDLNIKMVENLYSNFEKSFIAYQGHVYND